MRADRKSGVIILRTRDVLGMSDDEVRETILHEIAHAIVAPEESGHGPKWKATARSLGCRDNPFGADPLTLELAKLIRKARRL